MNPMQARQSFRLWRTSLSHLLVGQLALCLVMQAGAFSAAASSQNFQRARVLPEVELKVRGVGLCTSYAGVRHQLGRPRRIERRKDLDTTCAPPHRVWTLSYDGLRIALFGGLERDDFQVVSIEVTSSRWLIHPGVRIGTNERETGLHLGAPLAAKDEAGDRVFSYPNKGNDGYAIFHYDSDRLVMVSWESALC